MGYFGTSGMGISGPEVWCPPAFCSKPRAGTAWYGWCLAMLAVNELMEFDWVLQPSAPNLGQVLHGVAGAWPAGSQ